MVAAQRAPGHPGASEDCITVIGVDPTKIWLSKIHI